MLNLTNENMTNKNIIQSLLDKAEESYQYELNVYKNLPSSNNNSFPDNFKDFIESYLKENQSEGGLTLAAGFQKGLRDLIFGIPVDDSVNDFIDILYKQEVRDKLTRSNINGKKHSMEVDKLKKIAEDFRKGAFIVGENSTFLTEEQKKVSSNFFNDVRDNIFNALIQNPNAIASYIGQSVTDVENEEFQEKLAMSIAQSLAEQSFEINAKAVKAGASVKIENGKLSVPIDMKSSKLLLGKGRTIKVQQEKGNSGIMQLVPIQEPLVEIQAMVDSQTINDQKQEVEFVITLNMQWEKMDKIIKNALDHFKENSNGADYLTSVNSPDIDIQGGTIALRYASNSANTSNIIESLIEAYGEEVKEAIKEYDINVIGNKTSDAADKFQKWFDGIKENFKNLINKNPHIQNEILKATTAAQVSGTILGEVMFSLLASKGKLSNNGNNLSILGQNVTESGQAAVDIKLSFDDEKKALTAVGFQIKTFPSVTSSNFMLYGQSNRIADQTAMRRYLDADAYKTITEIFLEDIFIEPTVYSKDKEKRTPELEKAFNIFMTNISSYIRYEQMDLIDQTVKNNFYVINFNFVPASVVFYCLAYAIYKQINSAKTNLMDIDGLFNFSYKYSIERETTKDGVTTTKKENILSKSGKSFSESWDNMLSQELFVQNNQVNLDNIKKYLYINFEGVKIQFKDNIAAWFNATSSSK